MTQTRVARRLLHLLRPLAPLMAASATSRVINQGLGVAIPTLAAALIVGIGIGSDVRGMVALLAGLAVIKGTFRYVEQFTGHAVAFRLLASLRVDTFRRVVPLAPAGLEDERTGDLVARVIGDVDRVEPFYAHTIAPLVSATVVPIFAAIGLAVWVDPAIAVVFVPFPLMIALGVPWLRARRVAALAARSREENGRAAATLTDAVQGAREVAVFDARQTVIQWIDERSVATTTVREALARIGSTRALLSDLLAGAAVVAVTSIAVARLDAGAIDLMALAAAITVAWVGTAPARAVEEIVPDLEEALAAASRLFDLADREPPVSPPTDDIGDLGDGSVTFDNVVVRFGESASPALHNVDVEIADGAYVAVVGPSGSGKSTLVELLLRFRDPDQGHVEVGGTDIRRVAPARLLSHVTLVPQRPDIFFGTVGDNLRLADPNATDEELWEALDRAALGPWARSLELGLATPIGEQGETLSGGQRQRIAIARGFLRDSRILIFDEATSELDEATEQEVLAALASERGRQTVVVVAHRLETVTDADEILVLDRGNLVERGRHDELVAAGGVYSGLWRRHLDFVEER